MRTKLRSILLAFGALVSAVGAVPALANPTLLFDLADGRIISHQDAFQRWYPASLTKLMTAYVTFRAIDAGELALDSPIKISQRAAKEQPSKMGYKAGTVVTADNALKMMLVRSNNDIAMALGENVGGSVQAFADRMNAEAARLGMTGTRFANPNGLHSTDQYTTARDLGLLVMAIRREYPQYLPYFSIEGLTAGKKRLTNFNLLIGRYQGADGMKTGFICPSGFNMIGSATRGDRTLVAIVLGEATAAKRADAVAALLDQGFANPNIGADTVAALPRYGEGIDVVRDMREIICPKPVKAAKGDKPKAQPSEQAEEVKSRFTQPYDHPLTLVAVGPGGATGPVPKAYADAFASDYADVPIPTWRPEYPGPAQVKAASGQGDGH